MTDPAKLATWFEAHAAALVLYARQWAADRGRAEDVVQDVFVRLATQRVDPANVKAWLFASVRNAAIDDARAGWRGRRRERVVATARASSWFEAKPDALLVADDVQRALAALPPRQREVVTLRVWSGMTLAEVSRVTGLPVSTVHDEYRRGLDAIRKRMESPCPTT